MHSKDLLFFGLWELCYIRGIYLCFISGFSVDVSRNQSHTMYVINKKTTALLPHNVPFVPDATSIYPVDGSYVFG